MKTLRFVLVFAITIGIGIVLNTKIGSLPPAGKFFSPFHGFLQNAENTSIEIQDLIRQAELEDSVKVYFDEHSIPHVFATNEADLYFVQGYLTAFHRLWQMEFQLLSAEGRLSEILGGITVDYDKSMRRIGLKLGASKSEELFKKEEPALYSILESYSAGVNAYINSLQDSQLPIEYKLLDYKPEKWTPFKSFLLIGNMHNMLSKGERDLENTNFLSLYGKELFEIMYPERPDNADPIIPVGTAFSFEAIQIEKPNVSFPIKQIDPIVPRAHEDNGSNNFAVNGKKTKDGKVILANEPDLSLNMPSIWYIAHLNTSEQNVMGATLPGIPGIVIGYNDSIAWGETNAKRDLVDWYHIEFEDQSRNRYLYNDRWIPTEKVVEEIKVRGSSPVYDTILYTHLGPVVYDRNFKGSGRKTINAAMKWTAHDASKELKALLNVNKSSNFEEFDAALEDFAGPPQNFAFASANGDIGLVVAGKFPVKWEEQGKFLMDGNDPAQEWSTFIPYRHNLRIKNPERNFVSSGNQYPADTTYPYYQYDHNFEDYRGRRVNDRLRVMSDISVDDMMQLQHDNFNYNASEVLPLMLDSLDTSQFSEKESTYYQMLTEWDYFNEPQYNAPTLYDAWWSKLNELLWEEMDSSEIALYRPDWFRTVNLLKTQDSLVFYDNTYTEEVENSGDIIRKAFAYSMKDVAEFEQGNGSLAWFEYKNTTIQHILRLQAFSVDHVPIGGNKSIVNAASGRHGPSWRMVVELGNQEVNAWGVFPGNQSGNPGNPQYGGMIDDWASGNYYKMIFSNELSSEVTGIIREVSFAPN
ncbi:MAG: penicillin acylase family protein [Bacteroidota bacterium]